MLTRSYGNTLLPCSVFSGKNCKVSQPSVKSSSLLAFLSKQKEAVILGNPTEFFPLLSISINPLYNFVLILVSCSSVFSHIFQLFFKVYVT